MNNEVVAHMTLQLNNQPKYAHCGRIGFPAVKIKYVSPVLRFVEGDAKDFFET